MDGSARDSNNPIYFPDDQLSVGQQSSMNAEKVRDSKNANRNCCGVRAMTSNLEKMPPQLTNEQIERLKRKRVASYVKLRTEICKLLLDIETLIFVRQSFLTSQCRKGNIIAKLRTITKERELYTKQAWLEFKWRIFSIRVKHI